MYMIAEEVPMISAALCANCIAGGVDLFGEGIKLFHTQMDIGSIH